MNVKQIYYSLLKEGYSKKDAAKEAQERTGMSAVNGRPIKRVVKFSKKTRKVLLGQYG